MESPREVRIAIALSWGALAIETGDRLWRRATSPDAHTFVNVGFFWGAGIVAFAAFVAFFVLAASRRHNWGRVALLLSTLGGWCLWYFWMRDAADYAWWQWVTLVSATAMELVALILLFSGRGAAWYGAPPAPARRAL